jgi:uroporphyrin-3 C-methyltransferase
MQPMNENPSPNDPVPPSAPPASNAAEPAAPASVAETVAENRSGTRTNRTVIYVVLIALAVGLGGLWWTMQNEIGSLRQDVSRRLQTGESQAGETRAIAQTMQEQLKEIQTKLTVLETKHLEAQGQWAALEQLYQDLSKTRDDWVLAEIEQILSTASQQLQLAGNVRGAIIALQNADARLAQYDNAQFVMIRRAIAQDLEALQALPSVDLAGIALRLDSVIGRIDNMPLLADERPPVPQSEPKNQFFADRPPEVEGDSVQGDGLNAWLARLEQAWHSLTHELWTEVRQIVQVRKVGTPDALLVSPSEAYFARENLKLRLLNARLALLARNEAAFRNDLAAAQEVIVKYFDTRAKQTQAVLELLKQIQASTLLIEMPTLSDSLNAIRSHKTSQ